MQGCIQAKTLSASVPQALQSKDKFQRSNIIVIERAQNIWTQQQYEKVVYTSKTDNCHLWKLFKNSKGSACPVVLAAQLNASVSLMGSHPADTP